MASRKNISKKTRFEIFKRDRFQCQYCGSVPPDVVLEIDHIKPVAQGGDNSISNLMTACFSCNRGKGKRTLANSDFLKKSYKEISNLAARKEQLEMMMEWHNGLKDLNNEIFNRYYCILEEEYGYILDDKKEVSQIKRTIKKYTLPLLIECTEIVAEKHYMFNSEEINKYTFIGDIRKMCYW